jgi:PIN domain nuclease of toxin-antitoxin system
MSMNMERLTDTQQAAIERIIKKLDPILDGEDDSLVVSALSFWMLAIIQRQRKVSEADAAQYAAYHLKNYAHMIGHS